MFEQDNPLNDVLVVQTKNPPDTMNTAKKIEKMDFVAKVNYGQGSVEKIFNVTDSSRNVGIVLIIGLLFTAMFLISNTIKITIFARRREIEIMKLVGATNWFIRWPFFLKDYGLEYWERFSQLIIGRFLLLLTQLFSTKTYREFHSTTRFSPFIYQVSGLLILMGAFIGIWGSVMSVRKFLKI